MTIISSKSHCRKRQRSIEITLSFIYEQMSYHKRKRGILADLCRPTLCHLLALRSATYSLMT